MTASPPAHRTPGTSSYPNPEHPPTCRRGPRWTAAAHLSSRPPPAAGPPRYLAARTGTPCSGRGRGQSGGTLLRDGETPLGSAVAPGDQHLPPPAAAAKARGAGAHPAHLRTAPTWPAGPSAEPITHAVHPASQAIRPAAPRGQPTASQPRPPGHRLVLTGPAGGHGLEQQEERSQQLQQRLAVAVASPLLEGAAPGWVGGGGWA